MDNEQTKPEMLSDVEQGEYLRSFKRALKDLSLNAADLRDIMKKVASRMDADLRKIILALDKTEEKYSDFTLDLQDATLELEKKSCEHKWEPIDDSDYERCEKCDIERKYEQQYFGDEVL